jgi:endonuclease/exonuclease/phosphatase (EEP) superfamily protein YafD
VTFSIGKNWERVAICVSWAYALGLLGFFASRAFLAALPPGLALLNSFAPLLFLPSLGVVPLALWLRSKWALIAGAISLILFIGLYGALFFPRLGSPDREVNAGLRVMTFNLGWYLGQPEALVAIIKEQEADMVAVQEITPEMVALFEQKLDTVYPYTILGAGQRTTGLLSRYPILEEEWIEPSGGGRAYLHARVDWDGGILDVFVAHPLPPGLEWHKNTVIPIGIHDAVPQKQALEIARRAASTAGPTLMLGDFNMSDHTRAYTEIMGVFLDSYREGGWGFGFTFPKGWHIGNTPIPGPLTRLDYIFHSEELNTTWARVGCGGGSDHCYVLAQLTRKPSIGGGNGQFFSRRD